MRVKTLIAGVIIAGAAVLPAVAFAGGPADTPSCLVTNSPPGATSLRGTVSAAVVDASTQANTDVDFTLRLERGGTRKFFRASINMQAYAASNEGILCTLLDSSTSDAALQLRAAIRSAFGFAPNARFWLTSKSVSNAEIQGEVAQWFCSETYTDPASLTPPVTCLLPRAGSMADVVIWVK